MRKIAVVKTNTTSFYDSDGYPDYKDVIDSITDWQEVSDEDYNILEKGIKAFYNNNYKYIIFEFIEDIPLLVKDYIDKFKQIEEEKALQKQKEQEKRLKKAKTIALNKEKQEKELFEKLKKQFENEQ